MGKRLALLAGLAVLVAAVVVPMLALAANKPVSAKLTGKKARDRRDPRVPDRYYVNIHNSAFPNGAIRGQLAFGTKG